MDDGLCFLELRRSKGLLHKNVDGTEQGDFIDDLKWSRYTKHIYKPWLSNLEHLIKFSLWNWASACFLHGHPARERQGYGTECASPMYLQGQVAWWDHLSCQFICFDPLSPMSLQMMKTQGMNDWRWVCHLRVMLLTAGPCWLSPHLVMEPGPVGGGTCSCGHGEALSTALSWKSDSMFKRWHGTLPDGNASN